jgi:hypothetical protein
VWRASLATDSVTKTGFDDLIREPFTDARKRRGVIMNQSWQ